MQLDESARRRFADLSSDMADGPSEMLAVMVSGEIVSVPTVLALSTDGLIVIGGTFSESEAEARRLPKGIVGIWHDGL